jgi:hypothetical protein
MRKLGYIGTLFRDFFGFARKNKAYWIIPMIVVFAMTAAFIVASQTDAPFIYTLF